VRAGPLVGEVHEHHLVQQLAVDLAAELGRIDIHRADRIPLAVVDVEGKHDAAILVSAKISPPASRIR
jgi:hypothetical protein